VCAFVGIAQTAGFAAARQSWLLLAHESGRNWRSQRRSVAVADSAAWPDRTLLNANMPLHIGEQMRFIPAGRFDEGVNFEAGARGERKSSRRASTQLAAMTKRRQWPTTFQQHLPAARTLFFSSSFQFKPSASPSNTPHCCTNADLSVADDESLACTR
jgi:hypothetical protein